MVERPVISKVDPLRAQTTAPKPKILNETKYFQLEVGLLSVKRQNEVPQRGYRVRNKKTGIVEAEGLNYAQVLVGLHYMEAEFIRIVADPIAELERRTSDKVADLHALLQAEPGPDGAN